MAVKIFYQIEMCPRCAALVAAELTSGKEEAY